MSLWLWFLVVLAAAGIALALISCAIVLAAVIRLNRRMGRLRESPFVTKLESLQIQVGRLTRISEDAQQLRARAERAVQALRDAPKAAGLTDIADAWRDCSLQLKSIVAELS